MIRFRVIIRKLAEQVKFVIRRAGIVVRDHILNTKYEGRISALYEGDYLCRGRIVPMSPQLINKVKEIYKRCQLEEGENKNTPLILASRLGFVDMVWGFIQCAEQTHTNLHTSSRWNALSFLWMRNKLGQTALDVALDLKLMEVAKLLLSYVSHTDARSLWVSKGKSLLPLLSDHPEHDWFLFEFLEEAKKDRQTSTSMLIDNQQEGIANPESITEMLWEPRRETEEKQKHLDKLDDGLLGLNQNKNTVLHLVSKFGYVKYVKNILEKDPSLIYSQNSEGETPMYVAAREGNDEILEIMINNLKGKNDVIESLLTRSKDKHNALHIAIQYHHIGVVFFLLEQFPQLANCINDFNEGPLYLAAERNYFAILELILKKCKDRVVFVGPNGKTALHAAAISNSSDCCKYLLAEKPTLLYEKDENGWTPLHYAVYHNSSLATKEL